MGLAIAAASRHVLLRLIAVTLPVAMVITVLCTANHYLVDAIAGATLTALCWLVVGSVRRAGPVEPRPVENVERAPALAAGAELSGPARAAIRRRPVRTPAAEWSRT
ncbi:hypothetical protein BJ973_004104 [Actinoplanes tereljensis]